MTEEVRHPNEVLSLLVLAATEASREADVCLAAGDADGVRQYHELLHGLVHSMVYGWGAQATARAISALCAQAVVLLDGGDGKVASFSKDSDVWTFKVLPTDIPGFPTEIVTRAAQIVCSYANLMGDAAAQIADRGLPESSAEPPSPDVAASVASFYALVGAVPQNETCAVLVCLVSFAGALCQVGA
jgi:hypothetical protein